LPELDIPRFYVYQLVDPRDMKPFYVGKGSNRRAWQHQRAVERGNSNPSAKTDRIRDILACGLSVGVQVLADYYDEDDAFAHEAELIASLPDLTNIGRGWEGATLPADVMIERVKTRKRSRRARLREKISKSWTNFSSKFTNDEAAAACVIDIQNWLISLYSPAGPPRMCGKKLRKQKARETRVTDPRTHREKYNSNSSLYGEAR
jgi:hypothetical protein